MEVDFFFWYLIISGIILGVIGQGIRIVVGIKKQYDSTVVSTLSNDSTSSSDNSPSKSQLPTTIHKISTFWNMSQFLVSLLIGAVAGFLAVIFLYYGIKTVINPEFYLAVIAAGYAGADFIEGLMRSKAPKVTTEELKAVEEEKKNLEIEKLNKLKQLKEFKDAGVLNDAEFSEMREKYVESLFSSK